MGIMASIENDIKVINNNYKKLLDYLLIQYEIIPNELSLIEKKAYLNTIIDRIEEVELIIENLEKVKKVNKSLLDSHFCNIDENGTQIIPEIVNKNKYLGEEISELSIEVMEKLKMSKLVCYIINKLNYEKKISDQDLLNLQDRKWCKSILQVNHPVLLKHNKFVSNVDQRKVDGYSKYFAQTYLVNNNFFFVCYDLFEKSRSSFINFYLDKIEIKHIKSQRLIQKGKMKNDELYLIDYERETSNIFSTSFPNPCKVAIDYSEYDVTNWSEVLIKVCEVCFKSFPDKAEDIIYEPTLKKRKKSIFILDSSISSAVRLKNGFYVETNFHPLKVMYYCREIVRFFDMDISELRIYTYENKEDGVLKESVGTGLVLDRGLNLQVSHYDIDNDFIDDFIKLINTI
jgi:hypothetical protein